MRILIVGDPKWYAPELAEQVLNRLMARYGPSLTIVHGGGKGIDQAFAEACDDASIEQERHPARWRELNHAEAVLRQDRKDVYYNANAAAIRDAEMVEAGRTSASSLTARSGSPSPRASAPGWPWKPASPPTSSTTRTSGPAASAPRT
jgi:hypothetical protein